jgi:dipeptidyl aminopeptidase/acylaminoacyl peptidase
MTRWERRFRAPTIGTPDWSPYAPERIGYESTESGIWQVHTLDLTTGGRRQVTDHPVGVITGFWSPHANSILWWQDETGDESGRILAQPFAGGESRELLADLPAGWLEGFSWVPGMLAVAVSNADGFAVYVAADEHSEPREVARSVEYVAVAGSGGYNRGGLSPDASLLCLRHSEHGDLLHQGVRVIDPRTGEVVADLLDDQRELAVVAWSPAPGDQRLAIVHEREGSRAPALWNPTTGEWRSLHTGLDGEITPLDWWPDARALLIAQLVDGRHRLHKLDIVTERISRVDHPDGQVSWAKVRPDGSVWLRHASGASAPRIIDERGNEVLPLQGDPAPSGRPYVSFHFENRHGQSVQGFYVTPEGEGPWPILMHPHGGPTWLDEDRWSPEIQAYVDAGFAVGMVNYRGSTGRGQEWRDALTGDIGGADLEDLTDGFRWLVDRGIGDPEQAVVAGWSWGGYLTLMELGKNPDLWVCGVAGIPVGDYELSYEDMSPLLQAYDRALLGGTPAEVPELMRDRNPINFADQVRAPVLFVIGDHDSRCPPRQAMTYVDRLADRGHPHEVYRFATGHGSFDVDEDVRQQRVILGFLKEHVPGFSEAG